MNMKTYRSQITIYYNPSINKHKKTIAHAESIGAILAIPFSKMPEAHNIWMTLWNGLGDNKMNIFDQKHPDYAELIEGRELDFDGWRKVAIHNREMIVSPIAIKGREVLLCQSQTDIYQFMEVAS